MAEKTRKQILAEKMEALKLQLKEEEKKEKEEKRVKAKRDKEARRKWETNQKVRVGAAVIHKADNNSEKKAELMQLLDSFYTNDYDRKYFIEWGLPPQHKSKMKPAPPETENASAPPETENAPTSHERETEPA